MREEPRRRRRALPALAVFVVVLALVCIELGDIGITWDEPAYRQSELFMQYWFEELARAGSWDEAGKLLSPGAIHYYWQYSRFGHNFHPPLAGMLANVTWTVFGGWTDETVARRLSVAILFAAMAAAVYVYVARRHGALAGVMAAAALVLIPRLFAHAHIAGTDMPATVFWVSAALVFPRAAERLRWAVPFGMLVGLAFLVKFTGAMVVVPCLVWSLLYVVRQKGRGLVALALAAPVALVVIVALNPSWWHDPVGGLWTYLQFMLGRESQLPDIRIFYWGEQYTYSLPWHNAFVLMAVTVPVGILMLGLVGMIASAARARACPAGVLLLVQLWFMPLVRILHVPAHDGVRLFLPTFVFLAMMAGRGLVIVSAGVARLWRSRQDAVRPVVCYVLLAVAAVATGWQMLRIRPFYLSYYSEPIGGVRGAFFAGFEPTYWYDVCNRPFLRWLNENLPDGAYVTTFSVCPTLQESQSLGLLKPSLRFGKPPDGKLPHVVLVTHTSKIEPFKRVLFAMRAMPGGRVRLDGIPLVSVFSPETVARAWTLWLLGRRTGTPKGLTLEELPAIEPALRLLASRVQEFDRRSAELGPAAAELARLVADFDFSSEVFLEGRDDLVEAVGYLKAKRQLLDGLLADKPPPVARAVRVLYYRRHTAFASPYPMLPGDVMAALRNRNEYAVSLRDMYLLQTNGWLGRLDEIRRRYATLQTAVRPPRGDRGRRIAEALIRRQVDEFQRGLDPKLRRQAPLRLVDEMAADAGDQLSRSLTLACRSHERLAAAIEGQPAAVGAVARLLYSGARSARPGSLWVNRHTWRHLGPLLRHHAAQVVEAARVFRERADDVRHVLRTERYCLPEEVGGPLDAPVPASQVTSARQ